MQQKKCKSESGLHFRGSLLPCTAQKMELPFLLLTISTPAKTNTKCSWFATLYTIKVDEFVALHCSFIREVD